MYNSVLIYLIAFTIVTMAQPTGQESADPAGLWQVLAIVAASWALIRLRLRAIARGAMRSGAAA